MLLLHATLDDVDSALAVLYRMRDAGAADPEAYAAVILACARTRSLQAHILKIKKCVLLLLHICVLLLLYTQR
jgi:hypothetical protein